MNMQTTKTAHRVRSIGTVRREKDTVFLDIQEAYRPGLARLENFSPVCARVKKASIPEWLVGWPDWLPERRLRLEH